MKDGFGAKALDEGRSVKTFGVQYLSEVTPVSKAVVLDVRL